MSDRAKRTRWLLAVVAIAIVSLLVWWLRSNEPRADAANLAASKASEPARHEPTSPAEPAPAAARDAAPAPAPEPAVALAETTRKPDLDAREWITFRVENARGFPVAGAEIVLTGLRTKREPGSHYGWRGDPSLGKTAADGTLKLAYPVWVDLDDETGQISFRVSHPDYATFEDFARKVEPEIKVVLALGSVLVVSGWIGDPSQVITDVEPHFSWDVDVKPGDWLPRRDGRKTTTRVPQGAHVLYLRHESAEHELWVSAMTPFTLEAGETKELHLELERARRVTGRLDDVVPRPIVDGRIVLAAQMRGAGGALLETFDMPIREDGTFTIDGVMAGDAQVVALCKGWASKLQQDSQVTPGVDGGPDQVFPISIAQVVDVREHADGFVVAMEPTATLEVELRLPDGSPLAGASIAAWPNACWRIGACGMFLDDRTWSATTDAHGVARIDDIPADNTSYGIEHAEYDLPFDIPGIPGASRHRTAAFEPGKTVHASFTVERKQRD